MVLDRPASGGTAEDRRHPEPERRQTTARLLRPHADGEHPNTTPPPVLPNSDTDQTNNRKSIDLLNHILGENTKRRLDPAPQM